MIKVILKNANNGIIKKIVDDNYSGSGNLFTETKLYEIDNGEYYAMQIHNFIRDLMEDMGLSQGDSTSAETLTMELDWGPDYLPTIAEINAKIASHKEQIKALKGLEQKIRSIANE